MEESAKIILAGSLRRDPQLRPMHSMRVFRFEKMAIGKRVFGPKEKDFQILFERGKVTLWGVGLEPSEADSVVFSIIVLSKENGNKGVDVNVSVLNVQVGDIRKAWRQSCAD